MLNDSLDMATVALARDQEEQDSVTVCELLLLLLMPQSSAPEAAVILKVAVTLHRHICFTASFQCLLR